MRPRRRPVDPYAALGLAPGASRAEVRRAYRRRALSVHPDLNGDASTDDMARLNDARDELLSHAGAGGPDAAGEPAMTVPRTRRRPDRPSWATAHEAAWADYWSAWNELPRRETPTDATSATPSSDTATPGTDGRTADPSGA